MRKNKPRFLEIKTTSPHPWNVKIRPVSKAKKLKKKTKGTGDAVFRFTSKKAKRLSLNYRSDVSRNVALKIYGSRKLSGYQIPVNEITKRFKGKRLVKRFSGVVVVNSSGKWTLKR